MAVRGGNSTLSGQIEAGEQRGANGGEVASQISSEGASRARLKRFMLFVTSTLPIPSGR